MKVVLFGRGGKVGQVLAPALEVGVPCVVGTSGWDPGALGEEAASRGLALFVAPNFALGAVVMLSLIHI